MKDHPSTDPQVPRPAADDRATRRAVERAQTALDNTRKGYDKPPVGPPADVGKGQSKDDPFMPGNGA